MAAEGWHPEPFINHDGNRDERLRLDLASGELLADQTGLVFAWSPEEALTEAVEAGWVEKDGNYWKAVG